MNSHFRTTTILILHFALLSFVRASPLQQQKQDSTIGTLIPKTPQTDTTAATPREIIHRRSIPSQLPQLPDGPPPRFQRRPRLPINQPTPKQLGHRDDIQQVRQTEKLRFSANKTPYGAPQKFCSKFGCDCVPAGNAKCCSGYRYDKRARKCRQLF